MRIPIGLTVLAALLLPSLAWAWTGKVVGISDGDTITVMHDGRGEKIRLYGVDTPERHQNFGDRAKAFTSDQVFGREVTVEPIDRDRYGRTVALVYAGRTCLNEELIKAGLAWLYTKYCKRTFCGYWKGNEKAARKARKGLWSQPKPVPPWKFRRKHRRRK